MKFGCMVSVAGCCLLGYIRAKLAVASCMVYREVRNRGNDCRRIFGTECSQRTIH